MAVKVPASFHRRTLRANNYRSAMKVNLDISSLTSFAFVVHFLSIKRPMLDQDLLTEKPSHKFFNREKAKKSQTFHILTSWVSANKF